MSVQEEVESEHSPREAGPAITGDAHGGSVASFSCTATVLPSPAGEIIVLRVAGEVDLCTISVLQAGLTDSLARGPCHLVVDLAGLGFCGVRGLALLVATGRAPAARRTGYSVSGASRQLSRIWAIGWAAGELPLQYPTAAAATLAAMVPGRHPTRVTDALSAGSLDRRSTPVGEVERPALLVSAPRPAQGAASQHSGPRLRAEKTYLS